MREACVEMMFNKMYKNVLKSWDSEHFWKYVEKVDLVARSKFGRRATFGGWDVEKVHAVAAQSAFGSERVQSTRGHAEGFLKTKNGVDYPGFVQYILYQSALKRLTAVEEGSCIEPHGGYLWYENAEHWH